MYINTLTITSKGQIVLPKKARDILNSTVIAVEVNDNHQVILSPVLDVGGVFAKYKKNTEASFEEIRDKAWRENVRK
ncbi:hypothetical protein A3306_06770 [Rickettsia bellii]|uniref:SpoVT-AbrB domain-containing protein n=2 Tax=Rickettsia bellii TaxID=33990 RepID=A0A0F3QGN6_RICBE|nr:AbrB/MazE/SpoVT family DNA-binding domain-containing protein [Rickettsia bellii]ABV79047.1 hypothetical protein A1I_03440 [Rickettsia bellii OSU 85-389]ARD86819.1 hypothetical protein A3306_06770 [Rickettsia bellii]KJV89469.1 hypothetical protein RBEAN4_0447 [Rickettsia bellii str. RML An4]KJV91740.1 hypothetical protein RBEMOGI_0348 [Rickettsia bellii str. RML Mogi]